jgi:membrane associated rhomboid family serine protease
MGFESRDYARTDDYSYASRGSRMSIVSWIIIVNIAVFVLQCVWTRPLRTSDLNLPKNRIEVPEEYVDEILASGRRVSVLQEWFSLNRKVITHGQIWRLFTYDLLHATSNSSGSTIDFPWHLVGNMYLLYLLGRKVADVHSEREFLLLYSLSAVVSGAFYLLWGYITNDNHSAIGASGAVAAILVVYAMRWPNDRWILYVFPITAKWMAILYAGMDLYPMLKQLGGLDDFSGIGHSAHIGGMVFGFLYQRRRWQLETLLGDWSLSRLFKRRPKLRVVRDTESAAHPELEVNEVRLQARLDQLLAKISEHGQSSLSAAEQAELIEASRYFQRKR